MSLVGSSGAAGTIEATFAMRDTSTTTCTLSGYPGAELLDSSGGVITSTVVPGGTYPFTDFAPSKVTLAPGQSAYFNAGYSDVPTGTETSCPTSSQIEVTPPNDLTQLTVSFQAMVCDNGRFTLSPVFASGSAASQTTAPSEPAQS